MYQNMTFQRRDETDDLRHHAKRRNTSKSISSSTENTNGLNDYQLPSSRLIFTAAEKSWQKKVFSRCKTSDKNVVKKRSRSPTRKDNSHQFKSARESGCPMYDADKKPNSSKHLIGDDVRSGDRVHVAHSNSTTVVEFLAKSLAHKQRSSLPHRPIVIEFYSIKEPTIYDSENVESAISEKSDLLTVSKRNILREGVFQQVQKRRLRAGVGRQLQKNKHVPSEMTYEEGLDFSCSDSEDNALMQNMSTIQEAMPSNNHLQDGNCDVVNCMHTKLGLSREEHNKLIKMKCEQMVLTQMAEEKALIDEQDKTLKQSKSVVEDIAAKCMEGKEKLIKDISKATGLGVNELACMVAGNVASRVKTFKETMKKQDCEDSELFTQPTSPVQTNLCIHGSNCILCKPIYQDYSRAQCDKLDSAEAWNLILTEKYKEVASPELLVPVGHCLENESLRTPSTNYNGEQLPSVGVSILKKPLAIPVAKEALEKQQKLGRNSAQSQAVPVALHLSPEFMDKTSSRSTVPKLGTLVVSKFSAGPKLQSEEKDNKQLVVNGPKEHGAAHGSQGDSGSLKRKRSVIEDGDKISVQLKDSMELQIQVKIVSHRLDLSPEGSEQQKVCKDNVKNVSLKNGSTEGNEQQKMNLDNVASSEKTKAPDYSKPTQVSMVRNSLILKQILERIQKNVKEGRSSPRYLRMSNSRKMFKPIKKPYVKLMSAKTNKRRPRKCQIADGCSCVLSAKLQPSKKYTNQSSTNIPVKVSVINNTDVKYDSTVRCAKIPSTIIVGEKKSMVCTPKMDHSYSSINEIKSTPQIPKLNKINSNGIIDTKSTPDMAVPKKINGGNDAKSTPDKAGLKKINGSSDRKATPLMSEFNKINSSIIDTKSTPDLAEPKKINSSSYRKATPQMSEFNNSWVIDTKSTPDMAELKKVNSSRDRKATLQMAELKTINSNDIMSTKSTPQMGKLKKLNSSSVICTKSFSKIAELNSSTSSDKSTSQMSEIIATNIPSYDPSESTSNDTTPWNSSIESNDANSCEKLDLKPLSKTIGSAGPGSENLAFNLHEFTVMNASFKHLVEELMSEQEKTASPITVDSTDGAESSIFEYVTRFVKSLVSGGRVSKVSRGCSNTRLMRFQPN